MIVLELIFTAIKLVSRTKTGMHVVCTQQVRMPDLCVCDLLND
jgi:hypothetical protein